MSKEHIQIKKRDRIYLNKLDEITRNYVYIYNEGYSNAVTDTVKLIKHELSKGKKT